MRARELIAVALLVLASTLFSALPSFADLAECQGAISEYKSARSDISTALQAYADCVANNDAHDDCLSEFEQLNSAQDDFEGAVSKYETECN
jgi:hypothetical protein